VKSIPKRTKKSAAASGGGRRAAFRPPDVSRHLMNTYKRSDMVFTHGVAAMFSIKAGRSISIFWRIAVNALGYSYPDLVRTIRREAGRAVHVSNLFHNPFQGRWQLSSRSGRTWTAYFQRTALRAIEGRSARALRRQKSGGTGKTRVLALKFLSWPHVWRSLNHAHN